MTWNSTIKNKVKSCNCGCGKSGFLYADGKLKWCYMRLNPPAPMKRTALKKAAPKPKENKNELDAWFLARSKEMTGRCCNCNQPSSARSGTHWKWSIAHVIPKAIVKSVATHHLNWIELCISCHGTYDSSWDKAAAMPCFLLAKNRFSVFEPEITWEERRRIPECLLNAYPI